MPIARVGDHDFYYELRGQPVPGALPAVLIMGLGVDLEGWEHIAPRLEPGRQLLLIDSRGVGQSAKPAGPYTTAMLAADTVGVMDAAGIARAHVVGVSLGGAIAQEVALGHPERVASLALLVTFARLDPEAQPKAPPDFDPRSIFKSLTGLIFSPEFLVREKELVKTMFKRAMAKGFSMDGFLGQVQAAMTHDPRERLGGLRVPTLVVGAAKDRLVPPEQSRELAKLIPNARLVELPDGVHALVVEGAEEVALLLGEWLKENDGG